MNIVAKDDVGPVAHSGEATERERNAQHRLLRDSAPQTLEIVTGSITVDGAVRAQARTEAMTLRRALQGEPTTDVLNLVETAEPGPWSE